MSREIKSGEAGSCIQSTQNETKKSNRRQCHAINGAFVIVADPGFPMEGGGFSLGGAPTPNCIFQVSSFLCYRMNV